MLVDLGTQSFHTKKVDAVRQTPYRQEQIVRLNTRTTVEDARHEVPTGPVDTDSLPDVGTRGTPDSWVETTVGRPSSTKDSSTDSV